MRAAQQNDRLNLRHQQTQSWAPPRPDTGSIPVAMDSTRVRVEWDTRSAISRRHYEAVQNKGPTAVTSAMLQAHPTHGANPFMPISGRQDERPYAPDSGPVFFPDAPLSIERPMLPPRTLYANSYFADIDQSDLNVSRELRGVVHEENNGRGRELGLAARMVERNFTNQWTPPLSLDAAANFTRPGQDDWRVQMR